MISILLEVDGLFNDSFFVIFENYRLISVFIDLSDADFDDSWRQTLEDFDAIFE